MTVGMVSSNPACSANRPKTSSAIPADEGIKNEGTRALFDEYVTLNEAKRARMAKTQCTHSASATTATNGKADATRGRARQCTMHARLIAVAARSVRTVSSKICLSNSCCIVRNRTVFTVSHKTWLSGQLRAFISVGHKRKGLAQVALFHVTQDKDYSRSAVLGGPFG